MMDKILVNVRSVANAAQARKVKRDGRDLIIVPSATLPDNIVMNGILYPADEIEKSYRTLDKTPAPYGHPRMNGKFVSAKDPEGLARGWIGAWNENVRREGGRVLLDKVIDVAIANQSENGKAVLAAIEAGGPVHTSTGLLCRLDVTNKTDKAKRGTARGIVFDHDAILLNEDGAATPKDGVGMLVNESGEQEDCEVVNSELPSWYDDEIDAAGRRLVSALKQKEDASLWGEMKDSILKALGFRANSERVLPTNEKEDEMSDELLNGLSAKVDALSESLKTLPATLSEAITNAMKPMVDATNAAAAAQKAKDDAELAEAVTAVVNAKLLDEETAKTLPLAALKQMAANAKRPVAPVLNSNFKSLSEKTGAAAYKLPKAEAH